MKGARVAKQKPIKIAHFGRERENVTYAALSAYAPARSGQSRRNDLRARKPNWKLGPTERIVLPWRILTSNR